MVTGCGPQSKATVPPFATARTTAREVQEPGQQVQQGRIRQRDACLDLPRAEERQRDRQRDEHEQVEVQHPPGRAGEGRQEEQQPGEPDRQRREDRRPEAHLQRREERLRRRQGDEPAVLEALRQRLLEQLDELLVEPVGHRERDHQREHRHD